MADLVVAVIPARYGSERLPGKPLLPLAGKPILAHTISAAKACRAIDKVLVATDHNDIFAIAEKWGAEAVMTPSDLPSGSDRIGAALQDRPGDIVVNLQGDEPETEPQHLQRCIEGLREDKGASVSTLCTPLGRGELMDPDCVKVVCDQKDRAIYFSRAPLGVDREDLRRALNNQSGSYQSAASRHLGVYAYRRSALETFLSRPPTPLESLERLEQLRLLEHGMIIAVRSVQAAVRGIDTETDLARVRARLMGKSK